MALNLNPSHGAVPKGRLFAVLGLIVLFSEIATFEILMVYPALPHMATAFKTLNIAWAASIVTLAGATVSPLVGKAADRWGKKRMIIVLGCVFVIGSLICAVATSLPMLLVGRALQGGLVGVVTLSYSLVRDIVPRDIVPIALGVVVTGIGMSAIAGPFLAGWLIDGFDYRGVFWFMAAYVVVLLPLYAALVPESPVRVDRPIDYLGVVLLGPGIVIVLMGVGNAKTAGWGSASTATMLLVGIAMLVAFVFRQRVARNPLIDLNVLLGRRFGPTVLAVSCVAYMMNAHALMIPAMLQTPKGVPGLGYGAGLTATQLAIWTCWLGIVSMFVGPLGGYLAKKIGARQVLLASAVLFLLAMFLGSRLFNAQWQVAIMSVTAGFAVGFLHSSNANLIQDALPPSQNGVGTSISGMCALLAAGIATTLTGIVMSKHVLTVDQHTRSVLYADSAFTQGYLYAAVVGVVGLVVALVMKHGRQPAQGGLTEPGNDARPTEDARPHGAGRGA
ncbi:MFS transporter [Microtetraspora fusca]|uniref:MFS transporter n=1 Tax=Microtetraspora fusca TaxID=1997 RepID=UPI000829DC89|nr:MFS transporter [Microtetraspora fusca]